MFIDRFCKVKNSYNNFWLSSRIRRRRILSLTGFTIIELMISLSILAMGVAGISLVYITTERMRDTGITGLNTEFVGTQLKSQAVEEFISRNFKTAKWAGVQNAGDTIEIDIPQDSSGDNIVRSSFYFSEYGDENEETLGSIFYDPDTSISDNEVEWYTNIYKIYEEDSYQPIFSVDEDLPRVIKVYFGYFKGGSFLEEDRRVVEFKTKMRNNI